MAFLCTGCGACCRRAGDVPALAAYALPSGTCRYLRDDNSCSIYADRPAACRVDDQCPPSMSLRDWRRANHEACNAMMLADGVPSSSHIPLEALYGPR